MYDLKAKEFKYISEKVYNFAKINLTEKKRSLIISRLSKRIRKLGLNGFPEYVEYLKNNNNKKNEFQIMIDYLSTNYSLFFREPHHFDYLIKKILPENNKTLNIWSAASSTGQEIYSILITIKEYERMTGKKINYNLYASDISSDVLKKACTGIFQKEDINKIDKKTLKLYFLKGKGNESDYVKIKKELIKKITFFKLNLSDSKYKLPKMDIIFLRNVIIYFDKETKIKLINRLYDYLNPKGYLLLGHSESLNGISDKFNLIGKTIYQRSEG